MIQLLLGNRWGAPLLWLLLHSLDYYLTLWSIVIHRAGADQKLDVGGSLELNPVMRGALERRSRVSFRFLLTLFGVAALLWAIQPFIVEEPFLWPFLLGTIVFTRLSVIGNHVHNIVFLRALERGQVTGRLEYSRTKVLELSVVRYGAQAVTMLIAALLSESAWLWGGAAAMMLLVLVMMGRLAWEWIRGRKRSP